MKNSGGSLGFNGQDNSDKPSRGNRQYDYNHSKLTPKTTGVRANLVGNKTALGKPSPQGDASSNDHGPIAGTATPKNCGVMKPAATLSTQGSRTNMKGNK